MTLKAFQHKHCTPNKPHISLSTCSAIVKKKKNDILESILIMFQRAPLGFEVGMKLEVVDKRNPILIRVASIVDTDGHLVKIHFDGWADSYDYWLDDDCMDIHPPGWCAKTGHPLTPPIC